MLSNLLRVKPKLCPFRAPKIFLPRFVEKGSSKAYNPGKTLKYIWPYVFPTDNSIRKVTWTTVGLLVASKGLNASVPFMLKEGVDSLTIDHPALLYSGGLFLAFAMSRALVILIQEYRVSLFSKVQTNAMQDISTKIFSHLHSLDYSFHQESTRTTLFSVNRSMKGLENYLRYTAIYVLPTFLEFTMASSILLYSCGWPYLMTLFGTISCYSLFTTKYMDIREKYLTENRMKSKALDFVMNESMVNFETVKYFSNENLEKNRYNYFLWQKLNLNKLIIQSLCKLNTGQHLIFNTGLCVNLMLAVYQVNSGTMTVGDVLMIQSLMLSLQSPLSFMGTIYREINESQLEINELFELLETKSKVKEAADAKPFEYKGGRISIENIHYNVGKKIFDGVNIEIEPGSTNAFVGESGAGKSSLFRMFYRLFDPEEGRILIDGQDLKSLTLDSLRESIAIVPQSPALFNDTIYYNVSYGNPNASKEEIVEVCKLANIHNRIMEFPEQYESLVGELGSKLSGGERQRLALARCLLKKAKIYLLDEFTSAMDSNNEQEILESMKGLFEGKTVIYNTHRLSSIMSVDKIFVIDKGRICETGTHSELISTRNSKYLDLWQKFINTKK